MRRFAVDGDDFALEMAMDEAEALAAAPSSGQAAVERAKSEGEMRDNAQVARYSAPATKVVGAHTYYFVEDTWTRDDYEAGTDAPEVEVGSARFLELIAAQPELAEAATLGERVVAEGPDGWITIVWPNVEAGS